MGFMKKHHHALLALAAAATSLVAASGASAQAQKPATEQVVVPEVDRRDIRNPRYPSNDIEVGAYLGTYATQNFGASFVYGVRLGYAITEDFFVEGAYAQTTVSDESFRQILPGGIFVNTTEKLSYYNLSVGYNVLPGEVFLGRSRAMPSALYLVGGVGSTDFNGQQSQTFNLGLGFRVFLADWAALQVDMRDYIYSLDILGKRQSTQNLEFTGGVTFYF
jgi:outer membrane beta-barrel protein